MRIRGTIGDWPVDLTLELDETEWSRLCRSVHGEADEHPAAPGPSATAKPDDGHWQAAQAILRAARQLDGPTLLEQLSALAGGTAAGKRLLVRLRHSDHVRIESHDETPVYCWQE